MATSVTVWNRIEPRPRARDLAGSLTAEIRDPLWFLARQWQVGELSGEDAGSPAYAQYSLTTARMTAWGPSAPGAPAPTAIDDARPLERQALAEPFAPGLAVRVELGQTFQALLAARLSGDTTAAQRIVDALLLQPGYALGAPTGDQLNPLDNGTLRFAAVCSGRTLDGSALLVLAGTVAGGGQLPNGITNNATEAQAVRDALGDLTNWVRDVYGQLALGDPPAWRPDLIEYGVNVVASTPDAGRATMSATPDELGELQWSSFDVTARDATAIDTPVTVTKTIIPSHVRFRGMSAPRFWDFEEGTLSFADVRPDKRDILKALVADFMLVHGVDWFEFPLEVETGRVARINSLVVTDVFGNRTLVDRADANSVPGPTRWTMFTNTQTGVGAPASGLADFFVVPPSAGPSLVAGPTLEEVRFARDETANMAFGVERVTMSQLGEPRRGNERDAAVDVAAPMLPPASQDKVSPLRYLIETKVPVQYIPLLGVKATANAADPSIVLEKAGILRPTSAGYTVAQATGRVLNPQGASAQYRILEEQVPRAGVTVRRTIYRSRWRDGTTHVWIARRKQTGAGETQSGLRFDNGLPVNR